MGNEQSSNGSVARSVNCTSADNLCQVELFTGPNADGNRIMICGTSSLILGEPHAKNIGSVRINRPRCSISIYKSRDFADTPVVLNAEHMMQLWTANDLDSLGMRYPVAIRTHETAWGVLGKVQGLGLDQTMMFAGGGLLILVVLAIFSSRSEEDRSVARKMRRALRDESDFERDRDEPMTNDGGDRGDRTGA